MGIKAFDQWLKEYGLVKEVPLAALASTRLGIDASHYIRRVLDITNCVSAVGGAPEITATIHADLQALHDAKIKPVFVFAGITPKERERPFLTEDPRTRRRALAWDNYEHGKVPQAMQEFSNTSPVIPADIVRTVHRLFKQRQVEFVVAPYLPWAQLVYLERHEKAYVHSIYGPTEIFMFDGIDRIILDINFTSSTISFASKNTIMAEMGVTPDQFLDLSILAGFDSAPTFPGLDPRDFVFRNVIDLVKSRVSGLAAVMAFRDYLPVAASNYMDQFVRARCMIKFSLVLVAQQGRVLPLPLVLPPPASSPNVIITATDIPSDLGDIFSPHFPDEVYYILFRGLVGPHIINALASGYIHEAIPLCGGTPEYERHIKYISEPALSPKCVSVALLSSVLHPLWSKKQVSVIYYFDPGRDYTIPHSSPPTLAFVDSLSKWCVDGHYVESELKRQLSSTIDLLLCLGATASPTFIARANSAKNAFKGLSRKDEIVANTLWRFLELRLFHQPDRQHTPYARALYAAMKVSKVNDKFQEALFLALELLRSGTLHNGRIGTKVYSGGPAFAGSEEDKRSMLLVMRVMSIVPLAFHPLQWTGPLSRELLVFNSFVRATSRSLRVLLESVALNLLLRSEPRKSRDDYLEIALSLPFQNDTNTGMGILFKAYGDMVCHMAGGVEVIARAGAGTTGASEAEKQGVADAKATSMGFLDTAFPNVKNVAGELERGFRFWGMIMVAVRSLRESNGVISPEFAQQFEQADAWLKPFAL